MCTKPKRALLSLKMKGSYILFPLLVVSLIGILPIVEPKTHQAAADIEVTDGRIVEFSDLSIIQANSLLPISHSKSIEGNIKVIEQFHIIATAYSSSVGETDDTPFITAAGTYTRDGIVANNLLPFGTKIRMPDLFGDKIFVVEDRMNSRKGDYQIDVWFPTSWQAVNFGAKETTIEIIEEI